jgi:hypothetical protein
MSAVRLPSALTLLVLLCVCALAQTPSKPVAPLPGDSLELATGSAMLLDTPENRTLVLGLLERARQNGSELYAVGAPPFTLKVSFTANGTAYAGAGEMEETRYSRYFWRWFARLGDYSQLRIFSRGVAYDEKPPGPIPMRIHMVRGAVIWPLFSVRAGADMRMASTKWNGMDVMCALLSADVQPATKSGRRWGEQEYCVDTKAGLLRMYSEAPGIYTVYDYSDALRFHDRILARQITIYEGESAVVQIHVESIEDPPAAADQKLFTPTESMLANGPGIVLRAPTQIKSFAPFPAGYSGAILPVVVHATIDDTGKIEEAEALENSDSNLSNAALAWVRQGKYRTMHGDSPRQQEAFIEVLFGAGKSGAAPAE